MKQAIGQPIWLSLTKKILGVDKQKKGDIMLLIAINAISN